jgi:hypothetical protein
MLGAGIELEITMTFKQKLWIVAIGAVLVGAIRYFVLDEPGEFARFYEVNRIYVAPTLIVLSILTLVGFVLLRSKKVALVRQEQISRFYFWGSSVFCGAIVVAAVIYAKLAI